MSPRRTEPVENTLRSPPHRSLPPTAFGQEDGELGAPVSLRRQLSGGRQVTHATSSPFWEGGTAGLWDPCSWGVQVLPHSKLSPSFSTVEWGGAVPVSQGHLSGGTK